MATKLVAPNDDTDDHAGSVLATYNGFVQVKQVVIVTPENFADLAQPVGVAFA